MSQQSTPRKICEIAADVRFDIEHRSISVSPDLHRLLLSNSLVFGDYGEFYGGDYVATRAVQLLRALLAERWPSMRLNAAIADLSQAIQQFADQG